jgi:hypothetical protein
MSESMTQTAPYPHALAKLVESCEYRPGWTVELRDLPDRDKDPATGEAIGGGLTLIITTHGWNSYHVPKPCDLCWMPPMTYGVHHYMIVPAATYDERSWRRWLFEQFRLVESHECAEFFAIDGDRPYAPSHGAGNDPYLIREVGTDIDRRTSFRNEVNP